MIAQLVVLVLCQAKNIDKGQSWTICQPCNNPDIISSSSSSSLFLTILSRVTFIMIIGTFSLTDIINIYIY